jgi:hypothetical protein
MSCPILNWCTCSGTQVCLFCKAVTVICFGTLCALIGYLIGRKRRGNAPREGKP